MHAAKIATTTIELRVYFNFKIGAPLLESMAFKENSLKQGLQKKKVKIGLTDSPLNRVGPHKAARAAIYLPLLSFFRPASSRFSS